MEEEFIYILDKNTLTIKRCPDNILSYNLISELFENNDITNVIICNGVEKIRHMTFAGYRSLKKVSLPNTLKTIGESAFSGCKQLKEINIPSGLERIKYNAFLQCENLRKVNIPSGVKNIEQCAFENCKNLKNVNIEEGVEAIEAQAFDGCSNLKKVNLPSSIRYIGNGAFQKCSNLRKIAIPEGVDELNGSFYDCQKLRKVTLPSSLKIITNCAFAGCYSLSKIELPNNLEIIGEGSFGRTNLWKINIPGSVKTIGEQAFKNCNYLFNVTLNDGLKKIERNAFCDCENINSVYLPDTVSSVEEQAFRLCTNLSKVKLSKNMVLINNDVFSSCYKLRKIEIPEGVEYVEIGAFDKCHRLEEIHFPSTIKKVYMEDFTEITKLQRIFIQCNDGKKEVDVTTKRFINDEDKKLFLYDNKTHKYSFYNDGQYIEFDKESLEKNKKIKLMVGSHYIREENYTKLYYWLNKKIIPSAAVIITMPINDIDKFFINKNCNEWSKLVKESGITYIDYVKSFFKLCFVLGVFSESTTLRDNAVNFIRENIIDKLRGMDIHARFDGFELENGFNKEYAEFFMKYYDGENFMIGMGEESLWGDKEEIDLMAASYNNFKQVKKIYPNRTIHTNRTADLLLPVHVMSAVSTIEYDGVDDGNEEFAALVGSYGYNEEQFEILQEWYNEAKRIKKENMEIFICEDTETKGITYELLRKDDPRGAILGNITNCCQVVGAAGEECVEYGMTRPNSGFITFNYKDKIIGQAWVWYDEINKTICLDNIEIPHRYLEKINESKQIQESFIECLLRIKENFKKDMKKKGLEVNKVTIGKGYNDLGIILDKKLKTDNLASKLSDYNGYSDAKRQFEIKRKR